MDSQQQPQQQLDPAPQAAPPVPVPVPTTTAEAPIPNPVANPTPKRAPAHNHPPYAEMITSAISALNERNGSSKRAIAKYVESNFTGLPATHASLLATHLKRLKDTGDILMVKHSYKLPRSAPSNGAVSADPSTKRRPGRPRKDNPQNLQAAVPVFAPQVDINAAPEIAVEQGSVYVELGPINGPSPPRGRGRPPKQGGRGRGRGRPPKTAVAPPAAAAAAVPGAPAAAVAPAAQVKGPGRPRGRPPKPINVVEGGAVAAPVAVPAGGVLPVAGGSVVAGVAPKRRGRPPKAGGEAKKPRLQTVVKPKTPRKLSGKPLGRPKKNAAAAVSQVADTQLLVAYLDLKGKLENLQSRVKLAANVIKPCLTTEDAVNAFQELEMLATLNTTAPPNVQPQQPQPQS
uniref:HMR1 protein n=1 Tax=Antirrhinum majus TaxID=4151 RepID=Q9ZRM3_ANTMA|nr:HMR1 protein [Antirrhinum majus]